ncbi:SDR family oxidoreductase [Microbacterium schleiferi]|uniref:SDR family oxidoreductase n=1 Tax=Microbacterium schleiferi TaxID=69362 RepID=A0A7S8MUL4_9MICO|nr:SDR family oxidoreductase [Microbacterium schleiferi]QPE03454.1 SDR family oxidoreductase [Microbacterium schleiferi]
MGDPVAGKVVLVAGATGGMGSAVARAAALRGAAVVAVARNGDALADLADAVTAEGGRVRTHVAAAADPGQMRAAVEAGVQEFGRIDAVVNAVGGNITDRALEVLSEAGWRDVLAANLDAAFSLTQAALPLFRAQGDGLLLHITSSAAKKPDQSGAAYQAAKSGVVGLAHATMQEERERGIRVSVLFPGLTDTPLVAKRPVPVPAEVMAHALHPDDVADVCLALLALPPRAYVPEVELYPSRI